MCIRFLLCIAAGFIGMTGIASATPRISEFMAENKETLADEDGAFSDWVEIYNPDAVAVNLAGYTLTDDPLLPAKWVFPSVSLPSGGHIVVFASGKNRTNPSATLHTNFSLEKSGEYLAFASPDGTLLTAFSPTYPLQEEDRSYGNSVPIAQSTLIAPGATCRLRVPTASIANWNARTFSDTTWPVGATGIGYERSPTDAINYTSLISPTGNVETAMYNKRTTCYIRIPFAITSAAAVRSLLLKMKFDDGFIAYLNGTLVAQVNQPDTAPAFNSKSSIARLDDEAIMYQNFDISAFRATLVDGTNVLAIHGLNQSTISPDFLILPELIVTANENNLPLVTGYFPVSTPGTLNGTPVQGFVKDTQFSVHRGMFQSPFTTSMTTSTPDAEIRYTTDGSEPTATTGMVYTGPIGISTTTVIRAAAFKSNWQPSNVDTQTYVFAAQVKDQPAAPLGFPTTWGHTYHSLSNTFEDPPVAADYQMNPGIVNSPAYAGTVLPALETTLPVLSLVGNTSEIFGRLGIYSDGRLSGTEIPSSVEFFGPDSGEGFQIRCGLRTHGGNALIDHPKKPFRIYFRKEYGVGKLNFPLYLNSPVTSFDSLQLRPGGHDGWAVPFGGTPNDLAWHATYIRDQFLRQTELAQGRLSPHGRFVHLFINGLYWGHYNLHEVPSDQFFKSYRGGTALNWDVVEQLGNPGYDVVDGNGDALDTLLSMCRPSTRPSGPLIYDQIQRYLDVDDFIDHMITQIWAGNNDWMGPVYRGIEDATSSLNKNWNAGRLSRGPFETSFFFSVWDAEISMGTQFYSANAGHNIVDFDHTRVGEPYLDEPMGAPAEIYNALRSNADFRRRFGDRLQKNFFNNGPMTVANNQARLAALRATLSLPMVLESARWGDVNGVAFTRDEHWTNEMDWLANTFLTQRNAIVLGQFTARGLFPTVTAPILSPFGGLLPAGAQLTMTNLNAGGGTVYYTTDGTDPYQLAGPLQTKLIDGNSPSKWWVPTTSTLGESWKNTADPANIALWSAGTAALGYDQATTYKPHFKTDVSSMTGVNATIYVRIPFTIASQAQLDSITGMTLRVKYDDGCATYLNGSPVIDSLSAPATLAYNSAATATRLLPDAQVFANIDWTAQKARLVVGTNYLCIQGLNSTSTSANFLLSAELLITTGMNVEGPSPTALPYVSPITLSQTGTVKARVLTAGTWSALTEADYIVGVPASATNLVLSEFNYKPADPSAAEIAAGFGSGSDFEYIELYNPTNSVVEFARLEFVLGVEFDFDAGTIHSIAPGGRALLVRNAAASAFRYGAGLPIIGEFSNGSGLSNGGERLLLLDAYGAPIFDFTYNNSAPWPNPPAGSGLSLVLVNPDSFPNHALPSNWRLSRLPGGSPNGDDRLHFVSWLAANGASGADLDDFDLDGLPNILEYALAGNPAQPGTNDLPSPAVQPFTVGGITNNYLTLTLRRQRGAEDIALTVQFSDDLILWTESGVLETITQNIDGSVTETWRSSTPVSGGISQYGRVRVVK